MADYSTCLIVPKKGYTGPYLVTEKYFLPDVLIIPFMDGDPDVKGFLKDEYPGSYVLRLERKFAVTNEM